MSDTAPEVQQQPADHHNRGRSSSKLLRGNDAHAAQAALAARDWDRTQTSAVRIGKNGTFRVFTRRLALAHLIILQPLLVIFGGGCEQLGLTDPQRARTVQAAGIVLAAIFMLRLARRAVVLDGSCVKIRNILISHTLRAADIAWFAPPARYGKLLHPGLAIKTTSGRTFRASVFVATPIDSYPAGERESAELNAWLSDTRQGEPTTTTALPQQRRAETWIWRAALALLIALLVFQVLLALTNLIWPAGVA